MVAEGNIEAEEGAEEVKKELRNAEETTTWRQHRRGVDETSTTQRSWAHAVQCCSMTVSPGGQRESTSRELQWWRET